MTFPGADTMKGGAMGLDILRFNFMRRRALPLLESPDVSEPESEAGPWPLPLPLALLPLSPLTMTGVKEGMEVIVSRVLFGVDLISNYVV
jgi:hypothetical protein